MAEIVDLPIKHRDFPYGCVSLSVVKICGNPTTVVKHGALGPPDGLHGAIAPHL